MKRWLSMYPFQGFVSVIFSLPGDYALGWWHIRVVALSQVEEKSILLEHWFTDRFDVTVKLPAFVSADDQYLSGCLTANHTNLMPVTGNATINVYLKGKNTKETPTLITFQNVRTFTGSYNFQFPMVRFLAALEPQLVVGSEIEVKVSVGERFYDHIFHGYARARIINTTLVLSFLDHSPAVFKPGMPFETHLAVTYDGNVPLSAEKLALGTLTVIPNVKLLPTDDGEIRFDENGIAKIRYLVPKKVERFQIDADFTDGVTFAKARLVAQRVYAIKDRLLHLTSSTQVGEV